MLQRYTDGSLVIYWLNRFHTDTMTAFCRRGNLFCKTNYLRLLIHMRVPAHCVTAAQTQR